MKIKLRDGREVELTFKHVNPQSSKINPTTMNQKDWGTYCKITHEGMVIAQGRSYLTKEDKLLYNKEDGRDTALGRAIAYFSPAERLNIKLAWKLRNVRV